VNQFLAARIFKGSNYVLPSGQKTRCQMRQNESTVFKTTVVCGNNLTGKGWKMTRARGGGLIYTLLRDSLLFWQRAAVNLTLDFN
jgi:hypothetical protein